MKVHRIAIFYAPAFEHPLWHAGSRWLGRDAGGPMGSPDPSPIADELTRVPARYGFHATLKPPFRLSDGVDAAEVLRRVQVLARTVEPFDMPELAVARLDDFIALCPVAGQDALMAPLTRLAATVVRELDDLRAPASPAELDARRAGLNSLQIAMLETWGYPFLLESWRFHMTLTRRLVSADQSDEVQARARRYFEPYVALPHRCTDLCLFVEPEPGEDFICWRRVALG